MTLVALQRVMDAEQALKLWRDTPVPEMDATLAIVDGPIVMMLDGEPAIMVDRLNASDRSEVRRALLDYPMDTVVRGAGIRSASRVFGYVASSPLLKRNSCRSANGAETAPEAHATICQLAESLASMLRDGLPEQHERNLEAASAVRPEWKLPGGLWTSGVVNRSASLPYHRDRNNLDAWSAMPVVRRATRGGHLHFPELALPDGSPLVAECADGDVLFFNGQRFMHGVTPMRKVSKDAYRFSCVYYPVKKMCSCLSPAEEFERGRARRTATETGMIERQRASGYISDSLGVHDDDPDE